MKDLNWRDGYGMVLSVYQLRDLGSNGFGSRGNANDYNVLQSLGASHGSGMLYYRVFNV